MQKNPMPALTYKAEKISKGYLGQCIEFPAVIVQAKTQNELKKKMGFALEGYFKAFPYEYKALKPIVGFEKIELDA